MVEMKDDLPMYTRADAKRLGLHIVGTKVIRELSSGYGMVVGRLENGKETYDPTRKG